MRLKSSLIAFFVGILCIQGSQVYGNDLYCRPEFKKYYDDMPHSNMQNMRDVMFKESDFKSSLVGYCKGKEHIDGNYSEEAVIVCPYNIKREQIRPLILSSLKELIHKRPNVAHINIKVVPGDERLADIPIGNVYEAEADYHKEANPDGTKRLDGNSSLAIYYGVPSVKMLKEYNLLKGKPTCAMDIFGQKKLKDLNDYPALFPLSKSDFNLAKKAYILYNNFSGNDRDEDAVIKRVAYAMGKSTKKIKELLDQLWAYYMAGHWGWGQEFDKFNTSDLSAF